MAVLQRLPYDILELIFDFLDKKTLLRAALVNRALNEIVSRSLYASVVFNRYITGRYAIHKPVYTSKIANPFDALDRRPTLRSAVRQVVLCTRFIQPFKTRQEEEDTARACEALALFQNVEVIYMNASLNREECEEYSNVMSNLLSLRRVVMLGVNTPTIMYKLPNVRSFDIVYSPRITTPIDLTTFASKVHKIVFVDLPQYKLALFTSLNTIELGYTCFYSPAEICELVADVHSLRRFSFACNLADPERSSVKIRDNGGRRITHQIMYERFRLTAFPMGLTKLVDLRVKISRVTVKGGGQTLDALIRSLAGAARLRRLDISSGQYPPVFPECKELMTHIISVHGPTLQTLRIPILKPTSQTLGRLLAHSGILKELWVCIETSSKMRLSEQLRASKSVETIRLYGTGAWIFGFAGALLQQTYGTSLREVQVYEAHSVNWGQRLNWKVTWEYDEVERRPKRRVQGPVEDILKVKEKNHVPHKYRRFERHTNRPPRYDLLDGDDSDLEFKIPDYEGSWEPRSFSVAASHDLMVYSTTNDWSPTSNSWDLGDIGW